MLSIPYLVGGFWKLPTIIECGLVRWGLTACPVGPGERTKLSPLGARLLDVEREEMAGPGLKVLQGRTWPVSTDERPQTPLLGHPVKQNACIRVGL